MAIEDADGLGLALGDVNIGSSIQERISVWLRWRMNRIGQVYEYTANLAKNRVAPPPPAASDGMKETKPVNPTGDIDDLAWLYDWKSKEQLAAWMEERGS